MNKHKITWVFILLLPPLLFGRIEFEKRTIEFAADLSTESVEVSFPFEVLGKEPMVLQHIQATCGCTTPEVGKKQFLPGEKGEIKVKFDFGERRAARMLPHALEMSDQLKRASASVN